jgi:tRNA U55 pseudouridine synthase TruB
MYGPFDIKSAVSLPQLEEAFREGLWERFLYPVDYVLRDYRAAVIDEAAEKSMKQGNLLTLEAPEAQEISANPEKLRCRAYAPDGRFLGILRYVPDKGVWQPEKVFI